MDILLHGCNGRMGQVITRIASEDNEINIVCGIDINIDKSVCSYPVYSTFQEITQKADVLIDFSNHTCIDNILEYGLKNKLPLVICTTGFTPEEKNKILAASKQIPILHSANMSIGINLLLSLVSHAASVLYEDFDMEIVERHHNQKLDAPSGTALMIADAMNESFSERYEYSYGRHSKTQKREKKEIGIHAVRGGGIVGDHEIIFAGGGEVIEISHSAISRDVFAYGAIRAARFITKRNPGLYSMKDVMETGTG